MSSQAPKATPGWYDDGALLGIKRYWDGTAWTEQTLPAGEVPTTANASPRRPSRAPIVVAVLAVLLAIAALTFAATRPPVLVIKQMPVVTSPAPRPSPVPVGDYSDFVESATRDLDDFDKDLDDVETTIDEGGFWRLLSNAAELRFNLEQLRLAPAPDVVAADWDDALDDVDDALQDFAAAIEADESDQRDALEAARNASAAAREIVERLEG